MPPDQIKVIDNQKDGGSNESASLDHEIVVLRKLVECPSQIEFSAAKSILAGHLNGFPGQR